MRIKLKNDHPIFFRLPSVYVEQIDDAAYDLRTNAKNNIFFIPDVHPVFRILTTLGSRPSIASSAFM